jgi:Spy/CpxP family protein refolding chaperone
MRTVSTVVAVMLSLLIASTLAAGEKKKGQEGKGQGSPAMQALAGFQRLNLTDDQQAKFKELRKEYDAKLAEPTKKRQAITTDEQKKAGREAEQKARDAGKSSQEVRTARDDAMKLSDDQKKKMAEVEKEMAPILAELRQKATALLTPEQREQDQKAKGKGGKPAAK